MSFKKQHILGTFLSPLVCWFVEITRLLRINKILRKLPEKFKFCQWLWQWNNYNLKFEMRNSSRQISGLNELIDWLGDTKNLTLVEIGSYRGESASIFLNSGKFYNIYCVDPWDNCYDINDFAGFTNMKSVEKDFDNRFEKDSRIIKVKGTIETLIKKYPQLQPDVIYIDGCHTYDAVKNDLIMTIKHLHPKLAICGHDFSDTFPGCKAAIIEICGTPEKIFPDTSWGKRM